MSEADPGAQIRRLRTKRQLTQRELAQRAGVSAIYIRKLEAGARAAPSAATLQRIARALGARVDIKLVTRPPRRRRS
jgi:transcriptional regulator with XRE-family HTH domain